MRSLVGIGLGFVLAIAIVGAVSFLSPAPPSKALLSDMGVKPNAAVSRGGGGASIATTNPPSPVVTALNPSSIQGIISSSTPSSLLIVLSPIVAALALGVTINRLYARQADSE